MSEIYVYLCGLYAIEREKNSPKTALESARTKLNERFPDSPLESNKALLILHNEGFLRNHYGQNKKLKERFCKDYVLSDGDFDELLRRQNISENLLIKKCLRYRVRPTNFPETFHKRKYRFLIGPTNGTHLRKFNSGKRTKNGD